MKIKMWVAGCSVFSEKIFHLASTLQYMKIGMYPSEKESVRKPTDG
jgi:hypothetical protein